MPTTTDEDVLRDLLHRATDDLQAPAHHVTRVSGSLRTPGRTRAAAVALTSVAAAAGVGVIALAPGRPHTGPTATAMASTATSGSDPAAVHAGIRLTASQRTLYRLASVSAAAPPVRSGVDSRTAEAEIAQALRAVSMTVAEVAALPTAPAALQARLSGPAAATATVEATSATIFRRATSILSDPAASAQLRAAVYKVLATTPGVTAFRTTGRPAVRISQIEPAITAPHVTEPITIGPGRTVPAVNATAGILVSPTSGALLQPLTYPRGDRSGVGPSSSRVSGLLRQVPAPAGS